MKNKTSSKSRCMARPERGRFGNALQSIYERNTTLLNSDATGHVTSNVPVSPAGTMLAGRLTGYQALRDQCRIEMVRVTLHPITGTDTEGMVGMYIERDPTAAIVATVALIADQFESSVAQAWKTNSVVWHPQQPTDRTFNLLNPGTVVLANIYTYGASFPASIACYNVTVELWATLRGRP